ncbi:MAG: ABC transporter ATP-binding protein [Planctomycetota bacterium]|nr:ABC transporter ATP-binding protein [Planctomycetota bacterium]
MSNAPFAVAVREVTFAYGERQALAGISFSVARGSVHGFLGPNGSGKSTLFKLLSTLVPLQQGSARILDLDLAHDTAAIRRRLGVVFQSPAVDKKLSVRENLRYGGHLYGMSGKALEVRIDELLAHADLQDRQRDMVGELSGGLRRRVEVAKGLLHKPEILLLDEASTGLDPAARRSMWALLKSQSAVTVLFTTHLMDEAAEADHLLLLDQGRVVAEGAPRALMRDLGEQILEIQSNNATQLASDLQTKLGVTASVFDDLLRIEVPNCHELVPKVMHSFGAQVQRLTLQHPTLEDVFLRKTGKRFVAIAKDKGSGGKSRRSRR